MDKVRRWPTGRIAWMYGAPLGLIYMLFTVPEAYWVWNSETIANIVGRCVGGIFGGAGVVAFFCTVRNYMVGIK
jgi:hypothetical protein